jgi:GTP-binding protein
MVAACLVLDALLITLDLRMQVRVLARAGNGGAGCDSLWSSSKKGKFRPPDGGNGGRGGDVIVQACPG